LGRRGRGWSRGGGDGICTSRGIGRGGRIWLVILTGIEIDGSAQNGLEDFYDGDGVLTTTMAIFVWSGGWIVGGSCNGRDVRLIFEDWERGQGRRELLLLRRNH
jgi:hypothetical protein